MHRRELLAGSACLASAGAAFALAPRRRLTRLGGATFDQITPRQVGDWLSRDVSGLTAPSTADSLVAKLYDEVVERVYSRGSTGAEIMMLLAHGASQTNELQLHRPEVCYPAFGYRVSDDHTLALRVAAGVALPARRLVAETEGRRECVVYWTRIGDALPVGAGQQRVARLESAFNGVVTDGLLARFSIVALDPAGATATLEQFIPSLLSAVGLDRLPAFVGLDVATAMRHAERTAGRAPPSQEA
jgi:EpsI family protein